MKKDHPTCSPSTALDTDQASRMLRLGIHGPPRPINKLLDRLASDDGEAWLSKILSDDSMACLASLPSAVESNDVTLEALTAVKEACKSTAIRMNTPGASLQAMVGYFFSVTAALALFRTNISSLGTEELKPILIDLASVAPPYWSALFERAWSAISPTE